MECQVSVLRFLGKMTERCVEEIREVHIDAIPPVTALRRTKEILSILNSLKENLHFCERRIVIPLPLLPLVLTRCPKSEAIAMFSWIE